MNGIREGGGDQKEFDTKPRLAKNVETTGWEPTCGCPDDILAKGSTATGRRPCVVLDPFAGAGTVGLVADRLQRDAVLIEISAEYAEMARARIQADATLLAQVEVVA